MLRSLLHQLAFDRRPPRRLVKGQQSPLTRFLSLDVGKVSYCIQTAVSVKLQSERIAIDLFGKLFVTGQVQGGCFVRKQAIGEHG